MVRRGAARVAYQRWDVDFGQVQVLQVEAPTPDGWAFCLASCTIGGSWAGGEEELT